MVGLAVTTVLVVLAWTFWSPSASPIGSLKPPSGPHNAGDVWLARLGDNRTTMKMIWCPLEDAYNPGEFQSKVTSTQGFWIGQTEVTQEQWVALMGKNPSRFPERFFYIDIFHYSIPVCWKIRSGWKRFPVDHVDAKNCQEFCRKAGPNFRLPTGEEWEYACRAGSTGPYAGTGILDDMGWYINNSGGKTHEVSAKNPNKWALYDMHGNLAELCMPVIGTNNYVVRGGSWCLLASDCCSESWISLSETFTGNSNVGFRIVYFGN